LGVSLMAAAERHAGLSSFGYTALDQLLLPLSTLPLVALLESWAWAHDAVGEPRWSQTSKLPPSVSATFRRTWRELNTPSTEEGEAAGGHRGSTDTMLAEDAPEEPPPPSHAALSSPERDTNGCNSSGPRSKVRLPVRRRDEPVVGTSDGSGDASTRCFGEGLGGLGAVLENGGLDEEDPGDAAAAADGRTTSGSASGAGAVPIPADGGLQPVYGLRPRSTSSPSRPGSATLGRRGCLACCSLSSYWLTALVPFHGLEFARTLLFFWLVTAFDVDSTYLTMTLVRVGLVWVASLLACSLLRRWAGIRRAEAEAALHPVNLVLRAAGSACLVLAILAQERGSGGGGGGGARVR
jgi:hypothetical protein